MAERTIRRKSRNGTATVVSVGEPAPNDIGNVAAVEDSVAVESNGTVNEPTINDYIIDEPASGDDQNFVDPASATSTGADTSTRRKRRSDAGTRRSGRTRRTSASESTSSVANLLFTVHLGMSNLFGSEVFAITDDESQALAKAVTNVSQYYDIPIVSEKALAWVNLATTMGAVYGPRFVTMKMRKKMKNKPGEVVEINATFQQPQSGAK